MTKKVSGYLIMFSCTRIPFSRVIMKLLEVPNHTLQSSDVNAEISIADSQLFTPINPRSTVLSIELHIHCFIACFII